MPVGEGGGLSAPDLVGLPLPLGKAPSQGRHHTSAHTPPESQVLPPSSLAAGWQYSLALTSLGPALRH